MADSTTSEQPLPSSNSLSPELKPGPIPILGLHTFNIAIVRDVTESKSFT